MSLDWRKLYIIISIYTNGSALLYNNVYTDKFMIIDVYIKCILYYKL